MASNGSTILVIADPISLTDCPIHKHMKFLSRQRERFVVAKQ